MEPLGQLDQPVTVSVKNMGICLNHAQVGLVTSHLEEQQEIASQLKTVTIKTQAVTNQKISFAEFSTHWQ